MVTVGLLVTLSAKPGKEDELAEFLAGAQPLAEAEPDTTAWFAIRIDASTFGIFDVFPDDGGRQAHLGGPIAAALMAKADELLSSPPDIKPVDVLAAKLVLSREPGPGAAPRPQVPASARPGGPEQRAGPGRPGGPVPRQLRSRTAAGPGLDVALHVEVDLRPDQES
jgi:quinol monooxygenase YgiN